MNIKTGQQSPYLLLGLFFAAVALVALVALLVVTSRADNSTQTATIENSPPIVDNLFIATSSLGAGQENLTLTETSKQIFIHGAATDPNSCQQIDAHTQWDVKFYRTDLGSGCAADPVNCYHITEIASNVTGCDSVSDTNVAYQFTENIFYNADATDPGSNPNNAGTDWTARVCVTDDAGVQTCKVNVKTEILTLNSLDITPSIAFGNLALGATSKDATMTATNKGNYNAQKVKIAQAAVWDCGGDSTMPVAQIRFSPTPAFTYANASSMKTVASTVTGVTILKQTVSGTLRTEKIYTKLQIPNSGAFGECTATLDFTAVL